MQSSCYGLIGGHGLQFWSSGQNLPLPFCAPQFWSLMIFLFGHSTQNYSVQLIWYTMPDFGRSKSSSSLGRRKRLLMICCGLWATLTFCCFKMRPIFSETPCTYGSTTKPLKLFSASCLVNVLSQFRIKDMG